MIEQHTAPYLDAVAAYAFRETARYHVPGHKGGTFADPVREGGAINVLREG